MKGRLKLLSALIAIFFALPILAQTANQRGMKYGIIKDSLEYAVLKFPSWLNEVFENAKPSNLTSEEIREVDELFKKCIENYNPKKQRDYDSILKAYPDRKLNIANFIIDIKKYKRQYFPVINEKGEKEVWVNCFCAAHYQDWTKEIIRVRDGGNCFFNLKINLTLKIYYEFRVNGEA